eukprot:TRINITY_DN2367_c1_g1_i3.p1 TRINITY_DN2367_c1_g1~~TRINITY_DN2367_c1_g1_i3.p1  ORF type:complete len:847 (-),score=75.95 TRINITY_DN2367_c1_g1_i3:478-2946(-)
MSAWCGCSPASVAPVKRYNILVPDVFPRTEPDVNYPISEGTKKKIKKLYEYVEHTPERIPKVSRRLMRKVVSELQHGRLGYVRIGVHAYIYLIGNSPEKDLSLYAKELVIDQPSLTDKLLDSKYIESRILAAELLAVFVKRQTNAEYLEQIDSAVVKMCACAARNPPPDISSNSSEKFNELRIACMHSLRENIRFAARISTVPRHLELIETCVLDNVAVSAEQVATSGATVGTPSAASTPVTLKSVASLDVEFAQQVLKNHQLGEATPDEIAKEVFYDMGSLLKDPITGSRLLQYWLNYLDAGQHWTRGSILKISIECLLPSDAEAQRQYQIVSALVRHLNSASMKFGSKIALLNTFTSLVTSLSQTFVVQMLVQLLRELPQVLLECKHAEEKEQEVSNSKELYKSAEGAINSISRQLGDGQQLMEVICGLLERAVTNGESQQGQLMLQVCLLSVQKIDKAALITDVGSSQQYVPHSLVRSVGLVISQWSEASAIDAITLLGALLPVATQGLRDAQVLQLLSVVYYSLESPESTPNFFAHISHLIHTVLKYGAQKGTIVNSIKLARKLSREAVLWELGRLNQIGPVRAIGVLALCNSILKMVAIQCQIDNIESFLIQLDNTHPQLGIQPETGELYVQDGHDQPFDNGLAALCKAKINTLAAQEKGLISEKLLLKLSKSAILKASYDNESQIISEFSSEEFKPVRTGTGRNGGVGKEGGQEGGDQASEAIAANVAQMGTKGSLHASESYKNPAWINGDHGRSFSGVGVSTVLEEEPSSEEGISPLQVALEFSKSVVDTPRQKSRETVKELLQLDLPSGLSSVL